MREIYFSRVLCQPWPYKKISNDIFASLDAAKQIRNGVPLISRHTRYLPCYRILETCTNLSQRWNISYIRCSASRGSSERNGESGWENCESNCAATFQSTFVEKRVYLLNKILQILQSFIWRLKNVPWRLPEVGLLLSIFNSDIRLAKSSFVTLLIHRSCTLTSYWLPCPYWYL